MNTHSDLCTCSPLPSLQERLAYITNKCFGDADLEYYCVEAGNILGLRLPDGSNAKATLSEVFKRLVQYKMVGSTLNGDNQYIEGGNGGGGFDQFDM